MIVLGKIQPLKILRDMPQGVYLVDEEGEEVLLPRKYVLKEMRLEEILDVVVFTDSEDRYVATTEKPKFEVNQFAFLETTALTEVGAFCDWGTSKDLFIPFRNQAEEMHVGDYHVVHMYLDEFSDRLVGTTKLKKYLVNEADESIQKGDEVDIIVYDKTDLGFKVIVNQKFNGLIYENEAHQPLEYGQELKAYVKPLRDDKKIDISLIPIGFASIEPNAKMILDRLKENDGYLPYGDKTNPDIIKKEFGISKKLFKKAIGMLYKEKLILLKPDSIRKA